MRTQNGQKSEYYGLLSLHESKSHLMADKKKNVTHLQRKDVGTQKDESGPQVRRNQPSLQNCGRVISIVQGKKSTHIWYLMVTVYRKQI